MAVASVALTDILLELCPCALLLLLSHPLQGSASSRVKHLLWDILFSLLPLVPLLGRVVRESEDGG